MNRTVYIFLCCLLPLCHLSEAAARSWTYGHVLRRNLWNLSENVAGIRQDSLSRSYAEVYGKWSSGGFRDSWQATDTWSARAVTESIRHFDKFSLKGAFSFDQTEGYGMCGSMFMKPGYYPLDVLEFTPGRKTRQTYALEGGFSADLAPNWRLGAKVDFSSANLAKRKDLRHMNWRLDMTVAPGFMYHNGPFSVGAAYVFSKNSEVIESEQAGSSEFSYYAFLDKGMMYGAYSVWDGSGVHLAEEGIKGFPLKEIKNGASVQFAAGDFFADAQYLHSSGTAGEKESVWFRFPGDEAALKAGYRVVHGESCHYVRFGMDWKRQVTDESVLEKVSENGVASVVFHGSNRIAERRMWGLAPEYEFVSGLWELKARGEVRGVNSLSSQMYPYLYSQELVTFSADVSALAHIWKFDVGVALGCAGGLLEEQGRMVSDGSGVQTSPFRLQDWYDLQMEYKTAPRINAALSCRFWCWKGLYCRVAAEWAHGFGLSHIMGADRWGLLWVSDMSSDNVIIKHFKIYIMKKFCFLLAAAALVAACQKPSNGGGPVDDNTLSYGGVTYKTVTLSNGQTWMAEPLRYVPEGKTVSDDPAAAAGIWYPYEVSSGVAKALKDEASVAKYGYLYDAASAFGVKEVTPANFKTFEGTRGICPEGWHIPTRADFVKLCGFSLKAEGESAPLVDETALFYDADLKGASVADFNEGNWNFIPTGYMNRTATDKTGSYPAAPLTTDETCSIPEFVGKPTMTYFIGSTAYQHRLTSTGENIQFFDMYGMFVKTFPAGKITVGYGNYLSGYSVRCIKDAQ